MANDKRALKLRMEKVRQQQMQSLKGRSQSASSWPITTCLLGGQWRVPAMTIQVLIARTHPSSGRIVMGLYLLDTGCLGVKAVVVKELNSGGLSEVIGKTNAVLPMLPTPPGQALMVIEESAAYAAGLGFDPISDFINARPLWSGVEREARHPELVLGGEDGKPFYVSGPSDDPQKVIQRLRTRLGDDGFHYVLGNRGGM